MLRLENISKKYKEKEALKDIKLSFDKGQIVGIFGENGAGKTTLMKCILSFVSYDGIITLDDEEISSKNIERISFATSEHSFFHSLNAQSHKEFYKEHFKNFKEDRFDALMEFFDLPLNKKIGSFSTGQKNQFEVVLALSQGADYILMDEPFSGNDIFNREDFYKVILGILEPNETIILSTHLIEEVEKFITRAVLIHKGQVIADKTMDELDEENISLVDFVKSSFSYQSNRVKDLLNTLDKE